MFRKWAPQTSRPFLVSIMSPAFQWRLCQKYFHASENFMQKKKKNYKNIHKLLLIETHTHYFFTESHTQYMFKVST